MPVSDVFKLNVSPLPDNWPLTVHVQESISVWLDTEIWQGFPSHIWNLSLLETGNLLILRVAEGTKFMQEPTE